MIIHTTFQKYFLFVCLELRKLFTTFTIQTKTNTHMKKLMMVAIILIASVSVFAQDLKFTDLSTELSTKDFISYVSKDGTTFTVGGKVKMGLPSAQTNFAYVQHIDPLAGATILSANYANREVEIKKIQVVGNLKKGYKVWLITNGGIALGKLYFDIEPALQTKELKEMVCLFD